MAEWQQYFGENSQSVADAAHIRPLLRFESSIFSCANRILNILESLREAELDKPTLTQPKWTGAGVRYYGQSFLVLALHQAMHRGNLTDARRAVGRKALAARAA